MGVRTAALRTHILVMETRETDMEAQPAVTEAQETDMEAPPAVTEAQEAQTAVAEAPVRVTDTAETHLPSAISRKTEMRRWLLELSP